MAGVVYIDQASMVERFTARQVQQVFADDGSSTPGPRLGRALRGASRQADAVLLGAYSLEQIEQLVIEDQALEDAICDLALADGIDGGRPEWVADSGASDRAERLRANARTYLKDLRAAKLRSAGETVAGANPHASVGKVNTQRTPHEFVFAPSRARPIRGGF